MYLAILTGVSPLLIALMAAGLGAIVGSFLNVVLYRFHTGRSLRGRSHCLSCGTQLSWYHLLPVVSYLALRGRCAACGARFSVRYLAVELLTAGLFALVAVVSLSLIDLAFLWLVVTLLLLIFVYDIRHLIIPDELTVALTALVSVRYGIGLFLGEVTWLEAVVAGLASLLSASFFFGLWWFSRGRWIGFGDVKLAVPLALLVGSSGAFSLVVLSFWIGAVVTLLWLAILWLLVRIGGQARLPNTARSLTMKSAVPFAPFLIASAILVYFGQVDVLAFFTYEF